MVLQQRRLELRCVTYISLMALSCAGVVGQEKASDTRTFELDGAKRLLYKQVGDVDLHLHVFNPPGWQANDHRAAIVFFFGGGWVGGTPEQFESQCRHLASRGMVAISAEYRVESRHGTQPVDCVADGKSAIRWVRENSRELGIDKQRIAAAGGSAGGHVAASTALLGDLGAPESDVSAEPDALVLFNPVVDTTDRGYGAERLGVTARDLSPVHHVRAGLPPTILFHGDGDKTVPHENAVRFQARMAASGNACQLVTYPHAAHGFFNQGRHPGAFKDTLRRTDAFLTEIGFLLPPPQQTACTARRQVAGRDLPTWIEDLSSKNMTARRRAAKSLGLFGDAAAENLTELLRDSDPSVRYWAAYNLANLSQPSESVRSNLEALLADDSEGVRLAAAYALAKSGSVERLPVLETGLTSDERGTACTTAELFRRLGPVARPSLPALQDALRRHSPGDYHVRGAVQNAIRSVRQDQSLPSFTRPAGGAAPRQWITGSSNTRKQPSAERPNILWISCEDISPNLGCYGDTYALTPNLDQLAREGVRFDRAFTPAGVCAVVRSGIITGVYPIALGSQHMRSRIVPSPGVKCFSEYLRASGYFCTNKSKTDYQFDAPLTAWDRQGNDHNDWQDRAPGQPFFSVINLTVSHESQIRNGEATHEQLLERLKPEQRHDPNRAGEHLPPIYPNTSDARKDWAWYHDNISEMDRQVGKVLKQLDADGLSDSTLVIFWGDHGRGLPRGKRWIYDSGVHVPMIARWPQTIAGNSVRGDLVSTQDLAPTMLSVAGITSMPYMHGRIFLGEQAEPEPEFLFFHRDRMDEAYELMRGARDHRFKYVRNYEPDTTYAQQIEYMDKMPTLIDLRQLHAQGRLNHVQGQFFRQQKLVEELYDVEIDPHETVNLAWLPKYSDQLEEMREAVHQWQERIGDLGMVPEPILMEGMRPGNQFEQTATPVIQMIDKGGQEVTVRIHCDTEGASIAYGIDPPDDSDPAHWKLYSGPLRVGNTATIAAKACRLGFHDSDSVRLQLQ